MFLRQKKLLSSKEFEATNKGVNVKTKSPGKYLEYFVPFEEVGTQIVTEKTSKRGWLYATIAMFILALIMFSDRFTGGESEPGADIFYAALGLVFFFIYYMTIIDFTYLTGDNATNIQFYRNKPSDNELNGFIKYILDARKQYLKEKYGKVDPVLPADHQIANFMRLRDEEIITTEELEKLKKELTEIDSASKNPVGFAN